MVFGSMRGSGQRHWDSDLHWVSGGFGCRAASTATYPDFERVKRQASQNAAGRIGNRIV